MAGTHSFLDNKTRLAHSTLQCNDNIDTTAALGLICRLTRANKERSSLLAPRVAQLIARRVEHTRELLGATWPHSAHTWLTRPTPPLLTHSNCTLICVHPFD